jgi:hypothetical protein
MQNKIGRRKRTMNPASIMKIMAARSKFNAAHPKFSSFLTAMSERGVQAGTVIELTVTRPGEDPVTTNLRVTDSDMELIDELRELARQNKQ